VTEVATRCERAASPDGRQRGASKRTSLAFWAVLGGLVLAGARPARAHHIAVEAMVPHWNLLLWVGIGLLVALEAAFVVVMRRRASGGAERLELLWTVMPLTVLLVLGIVRVSPAFRAPVVVPVAGPDAFPVDVTARQWEFDFRSPSENLESRNEIHVPAGKVVAFHLTSRDILHSFDIPSLGVHRDVLPGPPATLNLRLTRAGRYPIFCAALCGSSATEMTGVIAVDPPDEYTVWVANQRNSAVKHEHESPSQP
jgi:cytochrome c oxidase subunit 2